ncbi:MAG: S-adenosylmethionine:tRNA ribosyltransferase-isomerase [Patescibacteria group bacterium]|nr:S-adenosylmethionine:tRNA ribosyltransferase-isomerase [Patescibacteria group bacterium]
MPDYRYFYHLPPELIAKRPVRPRDAARLFVYDSGSDSVYFDLFSKIGKYLPRDPLIVMNDTKVVPARAALTKETGGKIEALFLLNEWRKRGPVPALLDRKAAIGAHLGFRPIGQKPAPLQKSFKVIGQAGNIFRLQPNFPPRELFKMLDRRGITPIPKYIKGTGLAEKELRREYQAVFAKHSASVAAPTASLHFTDRLLAALDRQGIRKAFITLDVGLGTFAPVSDEELANGKLHQEFFSIPAAAEKSISAYRREGKPVVAVGTTVVRALESDAMEAHSSERKTFRSTRLFIRPPFRFKTVDALITNFHLPESSLMMLV